MAYLAHDARGFFMCLIILMGNPVKLQPETVQYFWNYGGNIVLVQEPKEGPILKMGNA